MYICVVSPSYPTSKTIDFIFVEQLCQAFADNGHQVSVIAPQSITKCFLRKIPVAKRHSTYKTKLGNTIDLYRPYTVTFGNRSIKLLKNTFNNAVLRAFKKLKHKPDVCYGHFWGSIFSLYPLALENGIPLFGASGEENVGLYINKTPDFIQEVRNYLSGVVNVSSKNQLECLSHNLISKEKSIVIPNAVDGDLFHPGNKLELRKKLGFSNDDFIVAFTGQFVPRKGTLRLSEALNLLRDRNIKAIFMGRGPELPTYDGILHCGTVNHNELADYLACSDLFVLPTENEGCSNAIIEAMACGLPVISTDAAFNHDILNDRNSIMIDCHNIEQIANAIKKIKDDVQLREKLSQGALKTAQGLVISKRAEKIVNFMLSQLKK